MWAEAWQRGNYYFYHSQNAPPRHCGTATPGPLWQPHPCSAHDGRAPRGRPLASGQQHTLSVPLCAPCLIADTGRSPHPQMLPHALHRPRHGVHCALQGSHLRRLGRQGTLRDCGPGTALLEGPLPAHHSVEPQGPAAALRPTLNGQPLPGRVSFTPIKIRITAVDSALQIKGQPQWDMELQTLGLTEWLF